MAHATSNYLYVPPTSTQTMEAGTVAKWNLSEGEAFGAGDILCEVETDKATVDFEAQDEGVVAKILVEAGPNEIQCGEPIVITVEDPDDVAAFKDYVVEAPTAVAAEAPSPVAAPAPAAPAAPAPSSPVQQPPTVASAPGNRVVASPLAHTIAKDTGIGPLSALNIVGTGPGGRIIADDVREYVPVAEAAGAPASAVAAPAAAALAASAAPPIVGAGYTDYPLSPSAMEIAAQLTHSKQTVPHYYLTVDVALDSLLETRAALNTALGGGEDERGIAVNDLLVKAAAAAMKAVPSANASWMDTAVRVYDSVDVNVVVGSGDALYSPVVRDAGRRGVKSISDDIKMAVAKLGPPDEDGEEGTTAHGEEFSAVGTVTVMNMGMYGVKSCAPIIREPQAVALALGAIENRIVPNDDPDSEEIYKESVMLTATLSCDHRVVDGAVGAQWLSAFKSHVEKPATLLL